MQQNRSIHRYEKDMRVSGETLLTIFLRRYSITITQTELRVLRRQITRLCYIYQALLIYDMLVQLSVPVQQGRLRGQDPVFPRCFPNQAAVCTEAWKNSRVYSFRVVCWWWKLSGLKGKERLFVTLVIQTAHADRTNDHRK